ncbi:MAG: aldehyde ferredoxin oxidoreductase family protein [Candidatus Fermentithermobacillus carboniphilus]|uniref:Aldehyde ferredoxin oxidoreductase family protein n=1 Tax=Candidatus Fermentithermobacillus carboniphilus TaxID=3085328 RepID=A0AAT9LDW2_9FIRM|nr:MAG: aldehyde ferredoxin oxidoreductase family protein [Candidatus Fermentithermobacillus carboniphilus]
MKLGGYMGKILEVDLTAKKSRTFPTGEDLIRDYVGGRGFVAKLLWDLVPRGADPLSPENVVVIAPGPLTGVFVPASGKVHMGAKSPATGGYGDSNMGGHFSPEIKYAGYDALVVRGKAEKPVVLVIDDDKVSFEDAGDLWGKGAITAEKILKDRLGEDFQIAVIGPAGENLVKFACISHDFGRQAGRTGVGAVWGSKNLKAVAVRGSRTIPVAQPKEAFSKAKEMYKTCFHKPGFKTWTPYGTAEVVDWVNKVGAFPTKNFSTTYFERHNRINGQSLKERILITDKGCFGCPTPCGKYSRAQTRLGEVLVEGPEYETIALLGGNVALGEIEEVAYANRVADELGLDTISAGNVAAFAIECFEKGLLSREQIGRNLSWGDLESVVYLLEKMARREGIGDLLAEGVKVASEKIGGGSERFAIHVKGLEWSGYEARWAPAMMISYITCDVGAHHNRSWAITFDVAKGRDSLEGKADKAIELQHIRPLFDVLGLCRLQWVEIGFELENYAEIFPMVTGLGYSWEDLIKVSERIWNLTRAFSAREIPGFGRSFDYPPARFMEEPVPDGPAKGKFLARESVDRLLDDYYAKRGWTKEGIPTRSKLSELGLDFVAEELEKDGYSI